MSRASAGKARDLCAAPAPAIDLLADLTFLPCFLSFAKNICSPKLPLLPLAVLNQGGSLALSTPTQTPSSQSSRNGGSAFSFSFFLLNCKELLMFTDCIENLLLGSPINTETHPFKKSDPRGILRLCLKQQSTPIQEQIHGFH